MAQIINTNIASLTARNNLSKSQSALNTAIERLSSGLRINSAKDDAAGLAIATRFTTQINGLTQASRNANDGISLAQTAEGALSTVTDNLQRIRQLAVQSANATNSASDRAALDAEVQQRLAEVTRIAQQTSFNGRHVLDGTFGSAAFQVGANVGETITIDLSQGARADQIGEVASASSSDLSSVVSTTDGLTLGAGDLKIGSTDITGTFTSAQGLVDAINDAGITDLTASVNGDEITLTNSSTTADVSVSGNKAADLFGSATVTVAKNDGTDDGTADSTGVDAAVTATAGITLTDFSLKVGDGDAAVFSGTFDSAQALADAINAKGLGVSAYIDSDSGKLELASQKTLTIGGATDAATLGFTDGQVVNVSGSLKDIDVNTVAGANDTIARIDAALSTVSSIRSDLGAIQNRFQSTIQNVTTSSQNLTAARSRIQDADFAAETAALTRGQILQQAGTAMVAQANALPNTVLSLLR